MITLVDDVCLQSTHLGEGSRGVHTVINRVSGTLAVGRRRRSNMNESARERERERERQTEEEEEEKDDDDACEMNGAHYWAGVIISHY